MIDLAYLRGVAEAPPVLPLVLGDNVVLSRAYLLELADEVERGRAAQAQLTAREQPPTAFVGDMVEGEEGFWPRVTSVSPDVLLERDHLWTRLYQSRPK